MRRLHRGSSDRSRGSATGMNDDENDKVRDDNDEGTDADTAPGAPGDSDTALGDTDQHSDADA